MNLKYEFERVIIMKVNLPISNHEFKEYLKELLESSFFGFGQERFTGWYIGNIFSVSYHNEREFGRRNYPIFNKAIGFMKHQDGETVVRYVIFRGTTDPISFVSIFLLSFLIFAYVDTPNPLLFGLAWAVLIALTTFLCTLLCSDGQYGVEKLKDFFSPKV